MSKICLIHRAGNKAAYVSAVLLSIAAIQGMFFFLPVGALGIYFSVLRPILYIMLGAFCLILITPDIRTYEIKADFLLISVLGALAYLTLMVVLGYVKGFSHNPMNTTFPGILVNAWSFLSVVLIREYIRSKITAGARTWMLVLIALVFTFSYMDNFRGINTDYVFTVFLPILVMNAFATWAAASGGLQGNLVFQTTWFAVLFLSPYLPGIPKILDAIIIYILLFVMFMIADKIRWKERKDSYSREPVYHWKLMLAPAVFLVMLLLFGLGAFNYIPAAIASDSMHDAFARGSLVIVKKIDVIDEIEVGDVIEYRKGDIAVIHRVVEMNYSAAGSRQFITKGDNNPSVDLYPVRADDVVGIAKWYLPYIGYPALLLTIIIQGA